MDTFPKAIEAKLGFDVVRRRLEALVTSPPARDRLAGLKPSSELKRIKAELTRVAELQQAFRFDDPVPLSGLPDVRASIRRAAPAGSMLNPDEFTALLQILITARRLRGYFEKRSEKYRSLSRVALRLTPLNPLEDRIGMAIDTEGRIRDDASPELRRLRRLIVRRQAELREALQRELRSAMREGYATEENPTIRNGRMVIPVRAESRRRVEGFVQDSSASGQTVYIEPAACLNLNNEVRELEGEERREIERILRELTRAVRDRLDDLRENVRVLTAFDLLQAKARFANETKAVMPRLNDSGLIELVGARNPALQLHFKATRGEETKREVVPLDLSLGREFVTLIITGPNAGGKTVAMKTIGLMALMIAYGLPIPVDERSNCSIFEQIFVDIGDEQSIEEDLSTFSSHVSNLKWILRKADERSLVLIDEAGTGTDPAEGGALAQAVLEKLTQIGVRTIATTHHGTLKAFAHEAKGVENGSMEFDQGSLRPTYRFQPGVPGSSYAFEIARRMGLDEGILARAGGLVGSQKTRLEDLITTFESRVQELDIRLAESEEEIRQAKHERETYRRRADKLRSEREEIRRQALEEAERIVGEANVHIERTIREIREAEAERGATKEARRNLELHRLEIANRLVERTTGTREGDQTSMSPAEVSGEPGADSPPAGAIEIGDQVVLDEGTSKAEVLDIEDSEAVIGFGAMRVRADVSRLRKVGGPRKQQVHVRRVDSGGRTGWSDAPRTRLDVRGRRVDEALSAVTRMIDEAVAADLRDLQILHGKGTGALRAAIHEYLAVREDVASYEEAPWDEGGAGVTRVHLQ